MQPFPHRYEVRTQAQPTGIVRLSSEGLNDLSTAPPKEFDGPGDQWSPETLLVGAVADCFVFSFRSIASANKFTWSHLQCRAEGKLDKVDGTNYFTEMIVHAELTVAADVDEAKAMRLLERAERVCLISNSLRAKTQLMATIKRA